MSLFTTVLMYILLLLHSCRCKHLFAFMTGSNSQLQLFIVTATVVVGLWSLLRVTADSPARSPHDRRLIPSPPPPQLQLLHHFNFAFHQSVKTVSPSGGQFPSSTHSMADTEFDDPRRMKLLDALKTALGVDVIPPTVWACLWLSDIDCLRERVRAAQSQPFLMMSTFQYMEANIRVAQKCEFTNLIFL
jgi:hypothetical protein